MAQMMLNLLFLHAFCASAVGGDVLSERWANARRTFPQLRRNELGECAGSAREGCPRGRRNQRQGYMGLDEKHDLTGWQMEDSEHGSACGGEADHLPKRDSRSRKCTPQICSERVVIANKKIAMSPFSAAPQGTKSVPRTASERNGGTRLQHVWSSEGKICTSFWSLWGRSGSHSGPIFGPSGANWGILRPKWLASGGPKADAKPVSYTHLTLPTNREV